MSVDVKKVFDDKKAMKEIFNKKMGIKPVDVEKNNKIYKLEQEKKDKQNELQEHYSIVNFILFIPFILTCAYSYTSDSYIALTLFLVLYLVIKVLNTKDYNKKMKFYEDEINKLNK